MGGTFMDFKVAILTAFADFNPGYSLTGIVLDQAKMLLRHGNSVGVFATETCKDVPELGSLLKKKIPFARLVDYHSEQDWCNEWPEDFSEEDKQNHGTCPERMSQMLLKELVNYDIVFTHDLFFTGWNLPYFRGIQAIQNHKDLQHLRWLHWIHSMPTHGYDWWEIERLGRRHRMVFPNRSYKQWAVEAYRGETKDVKVIPHIRDLRVVHDFSPAAWSFIDEYPGLMNADVVQVYPASVDRLEHKRLREVILIFKEIKARGLSVCLICANQWATGRQQKEDMEQYTHMARNNGLGPKEFAFTSEFATDYEVGISKRLLMELMQCSNLFIFPTVSESFGLVLPEACLAGGVLPVINSDLEVLKEITHDRGLRFPFGSFNRKLEHKEGGEKRYFEGIAGVIIDRLIEEESIACKSIMRQYLNMDYLYDRVYWPMMKGASSW
jgi:glycosyltransferase involved in cell wall biosynthesis